MMKSILTTIVFLILAVSGLAQTRSVIVNTSGVVQSPTNFWSADVSNARTGLGLGTAATSAASAFQPSSLALSNLASGNGGALTNLTAANITGAIAISNGGSGATTAGGARTNLGLGLPALTNSDLNGFLSAIGLGISNSVSFENVSAINGSIKVLEGTNEVVLLNSDEAAYFAYPINFLNTNALNGTRDHLGIKRIVTTDFGVSGWITAIYDDTNATNLIIEVGGQAGVTLYGPIVFNGANTPTNKIISRNNLGLGWSALTNTNTSGFNASIYGSGTNPVLYNTNGEVVSPTNFWQVAPITATFIESQPLTNSSTNISGSRFLHIHSLAPAIGGVTNTIVLPTNGTTFVGDVALIVHQGPTNSLTKVRTSGSTNDLVTMSRFDESVEFVYYNDQWQFNHNQSFVEPIYFSGTNATANAAASRTNLGLGTTNLVQFAYVESPYFFVSDSTNGIDFETDAVAAITRTNLGLGATNSVLFASLAISNSTDNLVASLEGGSSGFPLEIYTTDEQLEAGYGSNNFAIGVGQFGFQIKYGTNSTNWGYPVLTSVGGTNLLQPSNVTNFRSAIGLPLPALTNTNSANFQAAIFNTNSVPTNGANVNAVNFNTAIHWMEVNVVTNGVTNNFRIPLFK